MLLKEVGWGCSIYEYRKNKRSEHASPAWGVDIGDEVKEERGKG